MAFERHGFDLRPVRQHASAGLPTDWRGCGAPCASTPYPVIPSVVVSTRLVSEHEAVMGRDPHHRHTDDGIAMTHSKGPATGRSPSSSRWSSHLARSTAAALAVVLLPTACSDDSTARGDDAEATSTTATTTTQPDASDEAAVRPHIESLLAEWDEQMSAIIEDPQPVAADSEHPLAIELADGFTDDSPFVDDLAEHLNGTYLDRDIGVRPGSDGLSRRTTLTHFTEASADEPDFVSFVFCLEHDGEAFKLSSGENLDNELEITVGAGEAFRIDGRWLLHRLFQLGNQPDAGTTGASCADVVPEEG